MKTRKIISIILLVIGICVTGFGGFFFGRTFFETNAIEKFNPDKSYNNQVVAISGDFATEEVATDEELQVNANSSILVRDVKMLQWVNDENGVRLALANYPVGTFTVDESEYVNPDFYSELPKEVHYGTLRAGNVIVDKTSVETIAQSNVINKTHIIDLNDEGGYKYKLTSYNGSYISASDEWSLGEVKIDLYEITDETLNNNTIVGKISDNVFTEAKVYEGILTLSEVKHEILSEVNVYLLIAGAGIVLVLIAILLRVIKPKEKKINK